MKIREHPKRRATIAYAIALIGGPRLLGASTYAEREILGDIPAIVGTIVIAGGVLFSSFGIRCPRCTAGFAASSFLTLGKRRVNYRQSCGISLDEPLEKGK